jgi:putative SOS response-associated peptidase YedK
MAPTFLHIVYDQGMLIPIQGDEFYHMSKVLRLGVDDKYFPKPYFCYDEKGDMLYLLGIFRWHRLHVVMLVLDWMC